MLSNTESHGHDADMGPQCCCTNILVWSCLSKQKEWRTRATLHPHWSTSITPLDLPSSSYGSSKPACDHPLWGWCSFKYSCLELQDNNCALISSVHQILSQETQLLCRGCDNPLHKTFWWFFCVTSSPHSILYFKILFHYYSHSSFFLVLILTELW